MASGEVDGVVATYPPSTKCLWLAELVLQNNTVGQRWDDISMTGAAAWSGWSVQQGGRLRHGRLERDGEAVGQFLVHPVHGNGEVEGEPHGHLTRRVGDGD